jgi:hypothetical protein
MTPAAAASLSHHSNSERREEEDDTMESSSSAVDLEEALPQEEKDARDHLTPTALVRAASGVHPAVRNADDLEKGDTDIAHAVDKVLASVPPSLERQTALPSQPGAFRAGGDGLERRNEAEADLSIAAVPPVTSLIEATLVEESAPPVVVAPPIYKGQIVLEEDEDASQGKAHVVTLSKKQVRWFIFAFGLLCFVAIVLSVVLTIFESHGGSDDPQNPEEEAKEGSEYPEGYWYEKETAELWEMLQDRPKISHHMALVSIVNPSLNTSDGNASLPCSPLRDYFDLDDHVRYLEREESSDFVVVSFTCGRNEQGASFHDGSGPDAVILMHDGNAKALNGGNRTVACHDAKHFHNDTLKYNQVFCKIPNDKEMDGHVLSFFFSCFSRFEQEPVASVQTHNLSAQCHLTNRSATFLLNNADNASLPEVLVTSPAAVVLSTQRLCRVNDDILLQNSILAEDWRNRSQNCSRGWVVNDDSDLLVCRSQAFEANLTVPLTNLSICASDDPTHPCLHVHLPNVTIYDQLYDNVTQQCSPASLEESLIVKGTNDLPWLKPWNDATLDELQAYMREQELWVERWLLPAEG